MHDAGTASQLNGRSRIVVGVDGSASSKCALAWAAHQARLTGLPLVAATVWLFPVSWGWSVPWPADFDPQANAAGVLSEAVAEVLGPEPTIEVETLVIEGHPAPVLVELSASAQLVVVGSRGHGEFAGMLLGSVSEFLTAHSHCPVVVVRGDEAVAGPEASEEQPSPRRPV